MVRLLCICDLNIFSGSEPKTFDKIIFCCITQILLTDRAVCNEALPDTTCASMQRFPAAINAPHPQTFVTAKVQKRVYYSVH